MKVSIVVLFTYVCAMIAKGAKATKIVCYEENPTPEHHEVLNKFSNNGKKFYGLKKRERVNRSAKSSADKLGTISKPPVSFQTPKDAYNHEFSEINTFKWRLDIMHSKLLEYVRDDNEVLDFGEDSWDLEADMLRLNSDFGKLTLEANLLRAEVEPWFFEVRTLFELLQYHAALRRKYTDHNDTLMSKNLTNESMKRKGMSEAGFLCLRLVKFELFLRSLTCEKWNPSVDWDSFETSLYHAEDEYELLLEEYQQLPRNSPFEDSIDGIFLRLIDILDDLNRISQSQ